MSNTIDKLQDISTRVSALAKAEPEVFGNLSKDLKSVLAEFKMEHNSQLVEKKKAPKVDDESPIIDVSEYVFGLHPRIGADSTATIGAMISRTADLRGKVKQLHDEFGGEWNISNPPERVRKFISANVGSYNHSSIAEMAAPFVYAQGFGWPSAWLLMDFPLFKGQEISTRAVSMDKFPKAEEPCLFCPPELYELHDKWFAVFKSLSADKSGTYKFDKIRWAIPGSYRTGVVFTSTVRETVRHLGQVAYVNQELADLVLTGYNAMSPCMTKEVMRKPTPGKGVLTYVMVHKSSWLTQLTLRQSITIRMVPHSEQHMTMMSDVVNEYNGIHTSMSTLEADNVRQKPFTYPSETFKHLGQFSVTIFCSIAVARDWHRHRPVMPWSMSILMSVEAPGDTPQLVPCGWFPDMVEFVANEGKDLWSSTSEAFISVVTDKRKHPFQVMKQEEGSRELNWNALHAAPLGSMVRLQCVADFNSLLYMLELRANAAGGNFEYREQAIEGLRQLAHMVGAQFAASAKIYDAIDMAEKKLASENAA